jgi:hypothetical protein
MVQDLVIITMYMSVPSPPGQIGYYCHDHLGVEARKDPGGAHIQNTPPKKPPFGRLYMYGSA